MVNFNSSNLINDWNYIRPNFISFKLLKLYLDNCCYNRPFDNQKSIKIRLETEAKLYIQENIKSGEYLMVWSYILDLENSANPFEERKAAIDTWKSLASDDVNENDEIKLLAKNILEQKIKSKDALHISCAVFAKCDYFLTTDNEIIKRMKTFEKIKVLNPVDFVATET